MLNAKKYTKIGMTLTIAAGEKMEHDFRCSNKKCRFANKDCTFVVGLFRRGKLFCMDCAIAKKYIFILSSAKIRVKY